MRTLSGLYRANRSVWNYICNQCWHTFDTWRQRQHVRELIDQELHYTELVDVATRVAYQYRELFNNKIHDSNSNTTVFVCPNSLASAKRDLERLEDLLQKIKQK